MQTEHFIHRILESENLTDELDDVQADWLLNWGISQVNKILPETSSDEDANCKMNALMALIRKVNHIMTCYQQNTNRQWVEDLTVLNDLFAEIFSKNHFLNEEFKNPEFEAVFAVLSTLPWQRVMLFLTGWPNWLEIAP